MKKHDHRVGLLSTARFSIICIALTVVASAAKASDVNGDSIKESESESARTTLPLNGLAAPQFGPFKLSAGVKSWNTAAHAYEGDAVNAPRYYLKNEYYTSLTHTSGWGLGLMAVTLGTEMSDHDRSNYGAGDPSVTIMHPAVYDDGRLKITGQFREYFPVSDYFVSNKIYEQAYYMFTNYKAPKNVDVFNQAIGRHFQQPTYGASQTKWVAEDYSTISKKVNSWFKYGVGQWTQVEVHDQTGTGTAIDILPFVDFVVNSNIFFEPRVHLPIYEVNSVYLAPKNSSLDNAQAEIYMQISI